MSEDKLLTPEEIAATERHFLMDAPIAELAEFKGISVDKAVKLRTEAVLAEASPQFAVSVRLIEPKGNLVGFASVCFGNSFVVDDFKVLQSEKGLFVGMPSKPDKSSTSGYRDTAKPITAEFRTRSAIGNSTALFLMVGLMLPAFLLAMYERDGLPAEKVLRNIIRATFLRPPIRPYKTENFYALLSNPEKEVSNLATTKKQAARPKAARKGKGR